MTNELSIIDQAKQNIIKNERAFEAVLPKNFDVKKFIATFCLEVQKNEKLAKCTNLIEVARDAANFGLLIGGLAQQSFLIPFQNWKTKEYTAQLIIGYKGYIVKLQEAGYSVEVEVATNEEVEKGHFEELRGTETKIIHRPIRKGIRDRESIALAYCIIKGKNADPVISVKSKEEIEEIGKTAQWVDGEGGKKTKESKLSNVWLNEDRTTDYGQQCMKTVIRDASKRTNLQIANEMSAYEGKRDEAILRDVTPKVTIEKSMRIESLKNHAKIEAEPVFEAPKANDQEPVQTDMEDHIDPEAELVEEVDQSAAIFKKHEDAIKSYKNEKSLNHHFSYLNTKEDLKYLETNAPLFLSKLNILKAKKLEEFKDGK